MMDSNFKFHIGDHVVKTSGMHLFPGVVVAAFLTQTKQQRYVVECTAPDCPGILHIFSDDNLSKLNPIEEE